MAASTTQMSLAWALVRRQHGVITRPQLLELGFSPAAIRHRASTGRLHPLWRGVYAVGRSEVSRLGRWLAAVLTCGPVAALSHWDAGALWEVVKDRSGPVHVSVPAPADPRRAGLVVHRRAGFGPEDVTIRDGIPVTTPAGTLVDLARCSEDPRIETAVSEADKHDIIDPEALRSALDGLAGRHGVAALRRVLDRRTFRLTDSELEVRSLGLVRRAGLPLPETGRVVNGFKVDFYWPALGLVVETDGLRYHRTPEQQARDRARDQAHAAAGLTPLRFTHGQVAHERQRVVVTLRALAERLGGRRRRVR